MGDAYAVPAWADSYKERRNEVRDTLIWRKHAHLSDSLPELRVGHASKCCCVVLVFCHRVQASQTGAQGEGENQWKMAERERNEVNLQPCWAG